MELSAAVQFMYLQLRLAYLIKSEAMVCVACRVKTLQVKLKLKTQSTVSVIPHKLKSKEISTSLMIHPPLRFYSLHFPKNVTVQKLANAACSVSLCLT